MSGKYEQLVFEFDPTRSTIARSNAFINGKYKLTLTQQRILLSICGQIQKDDPAGKLYGIPISYILGSTKTRNYKHIHKQAENLLQVLVDLPLEEGVKGKNAYVKVHLLSKAVYKGDNSGMIYFAIHEDMKPHFLDLKRYTKYDLEYVWPFKFEHSLRIYELLKEYHQQGRKERYFTQQDFKKKLELEGKYMRKRKSGSMTHNFAELNRKVLEPACQELALHSDIRFTVEKRLEGVTTIGFTFHIEANEVVAPLSTTEKAVIDMPLVTKLREKYDPDLVDFAVARIAERTDIRKPAAYLYDALEKGYFTVDFKAHQEKQVKNEQREKAASQQEALEAQAELIRQEYGIFWRERCLYYFEASAGQLGQYTEAFQKQYGHDPRTRQILEQLATDQLDEAARLKLGGFILQREGLPHEKDWKAYAKHKYQMVFE